MQPEVKPTNKLIKQDPNIFQEEQKKRTKKMLDNINKN